MDKPKYQIGELIPLSQLVVRGIAPQKSGNYLYFVQIVESDNCFVASEQDIADTLGKVNQMISISTKLFNRLKSIARNSDRNI